MGKRNPVEELFFKFDNDSNKSKCLIEGCPSYLTGRHASNLERHLQKIHPDDFNKLLLKNKDQNKIKNRR